MQKSGRDILKTSVLVGLGLLMTAGLPVATSAQQYRSPMPVITVCGPGEYMQGGVCAPRPRGGPGTNPGAGTGWVTGLPGYEQTMCQWENGGYFFCPGNGKTNPRVK